MIASLSNPARNLVLAGASLLFASALAPAAHAQGATYECKVEIAGGLKWESGRWKVRRLFEEKFTLLMQGDSFTPESAARALGAGPATCAVRPAGRISCADPRGGYLLFDPRTSRGGIAQLHGTTDDRDDRRDTVSVEAFSCERR